MNTYDRGLLAWAIRYPGCLYTQEWAFARDANDPSWWTTRP